MLETVLTLEHISFNTDEQRVKRGKLIVATDNSYGRNFKVLKCLNSVPNEYKEIEDYDWFTGKGYE